MSVITRLIEALTDPQELKDATSSASKEMYHFLRAVAKYGEASVLAKMVAIIKTEKPELSHTEATNEASTSFLAYMQLAKCTFNFQKIRDDLKQEGENYVRNTGRNSTWEAPN